MSSFDVESLFQSIDIILTQRLNALSYDTTVIASVVDDSDKDNGHYIVSDGTIKFDAYTSDTTYKSGDQVRVTVINGDWSQKKFIEGKYSDKENEGKPITYIPPLGTTLQTNFGQLPSWNWTLQTNGETYAPNPFKRVIPKDSDLFNLQTRGLYDVLTISADIETNLGQLSAGNYGLRLDLLITPEVGAQYRIQKFITFDSSEMIGNPYSFVIPTHQEKRIAIAELGHVTEIVLTPYQGITIADNGKDIPAPFLNIYGEKIGQLPIIFSNVQIGFGSDLSSVEDNTLKLFTPDVPFYNYNSGFGSKLNKKRLGFTWFNKNEHHEYIGFSDGENKNTSYDEIEYLKASDFDSRLLAQLDKTGIPSDELSLILAADIADAVPLMKSAYTALTTDLSQVLLRFHGQMAGATSVLNKLEPLISQYKDEKDKTQNAKLVQHQIAAEAAAASLEKVFAQVLEYGYNVQQGNTTSWPTELFDANGKMPDYLAAFKKAITDGINDVKAFLTFAETETAIGQPLAGYRRIYNDYQPKVIKQINVIRTYLEQIPIAEFYDIDPDPENEIKKTYIEILSDYYKNKSEYDPYKKDDFSAYANQYCVYWYRYNEGYKLDYIPEEAKPADMTEKERQWNNTEYKYAHFLGDGWERLTIRQDFDENGNIITTDEPEPLINFGLPAPLKDPDGNYYMPESCEDFLTRWLDPFTETEKYRVVLFYNHEMIKSDIVVFDNADEVPPQYKVDAGDVLKIEHDTDSRDHYQVYSSANDLLNISDGSKSRQLKCFYDGVLSGDETLADAEIYWYIPVNSTMLTYDKEFLIQKGFSTDDECFVYDESGNRLKDDENGQYLTQRFTTQYSKDGYVYFNKKIKYNKEIKDMVDDDGNVMFDSCGQALKETVITIEPVDKFFFYKIKPYYESSAQNNTILVHAYVPNKKEPTAGEITFTFGTFGNNGTKYTLAITPATTQIAVLPYATDEEPGDLPLNITLYNANNEKLDMTTDANGEYHNLAVDWWAASAAAPDFANLAMIDDHYSVFVQGIQPQNYDTNRYIGIAKANVSYKEQGASEEEERTITLTALHSISYSSNRDYYISGPTSIIYNSQGTVSRLSEEPYCLYKHTVDGDIKVENQVWSIAYYKQNGEIVEDPKVIRYLPKLMPNHTLQPSPLYCDYGDEHYVPVAICQVDKNIVWTQPIIIIQNAYESSMLNNWNGGLMIDEDNATIMAAMIGAGKKDSENRFSGVLMGDLVAGADFDSKNVNIGIHGFHEGKQSFNFSVDGTAFLGKAGRGRIIFNGNDGVIKSATTQNDSGMIIDLDDAWMEIRGPKLSNGQAMVEIDANPGQYGAYFSIKSEKSNKLIHIGSNNYYLQSDEFKRGTSNLNDSNDEPDGGRGMRIDLQSGRIYAYNFRLDSKNVLINSTDTSNNYLTIKDDGGYVLLNVGKSGYYLQSSGYKSSVDDGSGGTGMKIDLARGTIDAHTFKLNAWNNDSGIYMDSDGTPDYFKVGDMGKQNYIQFNNSQGVDIKTKNFLLDAWQSSNPEQTPATFAMTRATTTDTYTLTLEPNGGRVDSSTNPKIYTGTPGTEIDLSGVSISRSGYTFEGWSITGSGIYNEFDGTYTFEEGNGTLTAMWTEKSSGGSSGESGDSSSYTLSFNLNGGSWEDGSTDGGSITGTSGESIYGIHTPVREGYTFAGWTLSGGGEYSAEDNEYIFGNANATLTANWTSAGGESGGGESGDGGEAGGGAEGGNTGGSEGGGSGTEGSGDIATADAIGPGKGIFIDSKGNQYYLLVGDKLSKAGEYNEQDNYIGLHSTDGLDIKTTKFELKAWKDDSGIYINSAPEGTDMPTGYYLLVGKIDQKNEKNHNYIGLHKDDGLSIYTNKFELNTPTLQISSGSEKENKLPFFEVRTGYTDIEPKGKILAHIAQDKIYLQSENFDLTDASNNGIKIDITEKQILFGSTAKMSFIADGARNFVEITTGKEWNDGGEIALYVRPRLVSQDVYVTHALYGGNDPANENVNTVTNSIATFAMPSIPEVEDNFDGNEGGGGAENGESNEQTTGAKLPFPDRDAITLQPMPDDASVTTNWSINEYGKGKGIHLANSCLYGQITIGASDGGQIYGSTNPFFRCYVPAYIGQIAIQNNEIWNETGLTNPITFKSPVTFDSNIPTVFKSRVTFEQGASVVLNSGDMTVNGTLKIKNPNNPNVEAVEFLAGVYGTAACIKINDHLSVEDKIYAKRLEIVGDNINSVHVALGKVVQLGVSGTSVGMQVKSNEVWILGTAPFKCSSTATFEKAVEIAAGGLTISNGAFTCNSGATFKSNVIIEAKGQLQIGGDTLGKLAFADEVKKNLNITMTAALPSGYYEPDGETYKTISVLKYATKPRTVSGTATGTYVATGNEQAGEEYSVSCNFSTTITVEDCQYGDEKVYYPAYKEVSGTVTMKGNSGEIVFEPGEASSESESITISADSITVP